MLSDVASLASLHLPHGLIDPANEAQNTALAYPKVIHAILGDELTLPTFRALSALIGPPNPTFPDLTAPFADISRLKPDTGAAPKALLLTSLPAPVDVDLPAA